MRQPSRSTTSPKSLPLPLPFGKHYTVFGGPYYDKPATMLGVKMAVEIQEACEVDIPTRDFKVPPVPVLLTGLEKALQLIASRQPLYVGCMGGKGRTGLFLAALAKLWGEKDPVVYVRKHYYSHAVETPEQERYIRTLEFPPHLYTKVKLAKVAGVFSFRKNVTKG